MGFFSLVETFFFISLAITFVLIMMIVYHFKERLTALEQKTSTITEIMNNFLKELTYLKAAIGQIAQQSLRNDIERKFEEPRKIVVSDIEEEGEGDEDEEEEEEEDEEYDSDDEDFEEVPIIKHIQIHSLSENDDISEEYDENLNFEEYANTYLGETDTLEIQLTEDLLEEITEELPEEITEELSEELSEEIIVKKIDSILTMDSEPVINKMVSPMEVYRKMEIGELRSLVIQQGLATDTKKLKKMDLIRLLTNTRE